MAIIKYKYLGNGKYKIFLDDREIILYEDIIVKYNILSKKDISNDELKTYEIDNLYYDGYYKTINYLKKRLRSKKEIENYLRKNEFDYKTKKRIIEELEKNNFINDVIYTRSYINDQIYLKRSGPLKIKSELLKLGIEEKTIENEIIVFDKKMQLDKIQKYILKETKLNKNKSLVLLKNKILNNLIFMGYYREDIINAIEKININEEEIYQKEYRKIFNKLSKKYKGYELEQKIKQKLYSKGLYK